MILTSCISLRWGGPYHFFELHTCFSHDSLRTGVLGKATALNPRKLESFKSELQERGQGFGREASPTILPGDEIIDLANLLPIVHVRESAIPHQMPVGPQQDGPRPHTAFGIFVKTEVEKFLGVYFSLRLAIVRNFPGSDRMNVFLAKFAKQQAFGFKLADFDWNGAG